MGCRVGLVPQVRLGSLVLHQWGRCHPSQALPQSWWACAPYDRPRWTLGPSTLVSLSQWSSQGSGRSPSSLRSTPTSSSSPTPVHSDTRWTPDHLWGCSPTPQMQKQPGKQEFNPHLPLPAAQGGPGSCSRLWHLPQGLTRSLCPLPPDCSDPTSCLFPTPCNGTFAVACLIKLCSGVLIAQYRSICRLLILRTTSHTLISETLPPFALRQHRLPLQPAVHRLSPKAQSWGDRSVDFLELCLPDT